MQKKQINYWAKVFLLAGIYGVAAKFGLSLAFFVPQATTIWPPTGIAIAALLLFGTDLIPGVFIGAFVVNAFTHEPFLTAIAIGIGNAFEAWLCVTLLRRFRFDIRFGEIRDVVAFLLFSLLACMVGAFIGTASLLASGLIVASEIGRTYLVWGAGDVMGALLVTPLFLAWFSPRARSQFLENKAESILATLLLCITTIGIFFYLPSTLSSMIKFLIFPFLLWGAFRLGNTTTTTMNLGVGVIATIATLRSVGPFVGSPLIEVNLLYSHLFVYVASGIGLLSAAAIGERDIGVERLVSTEKRLRALVEHSNDGVALVDKSGNILYVTVPTKTVLGYGEKEIVGRNIFELIYITDLTLVHNKFKWLVAHPGKSLTLQVRARHRKGQWVWIETTATNFLDDPAMNAVVINYHDVTDRRRSEEKLESYTKELERAVTRTAEEMARGEALLSSIGDGFIATDKAGKMIFMNPAAEQMLDLSVRESIGQPLTELLHLLDEEGNLVEKRDRPIQQALTEGKTISTIVGSKVYYYARADGEKLPVSITAAPVILNGEIIGAEEVFKDITRDRQIDRAKSEFVSLTSHQLRTPLSIVNWYTEALLKGKLGGFNKKQSQYLKQIYSANQRLVNTVNNLLSVSRLEMGTFPMDLAPIEIPVIITGVINGLSRQIKTKKLNIVRDFKMKFPTILLDRSLFTAIVENLISNAVKYTPDKGTIRVGLMHDARSATLVVEDTGYGIPKSEYSKVFDRFYRGSNVVEKNTDGNGLGLYIVKRLVESMGGSIGFVSEQDKGTIFKVTVPIATTNEIRHLPAHRSTTARQQMK